MEVRQKKINLKTEKQFSIKGILRWDRYFDFLYQKMVFASFSIMNSSSFERSCAFLLSGVVNRFLSMIVK